MSTERLTVLLVDDDADVRDLLEVMLGADGRFAIVGHAPDAPTAVALTEELQPDVVILDLYLPGMDGWTALPVLRQSAPGARIVVVSAYPDPYTLVDAVSGGADAYLDKSRVWRELIPTLQGLTTPV